MNTTRSLVIALAVALSAAGLVMVYSATSTSAGGAATNLRLAVRQAAWLGVSLVAMCVVSRIDYHTYSRWSRVVLFASFALLVVTLVFGAEINGARRWIRVGPFSFQPTEFVKFALVLYCAEFLTRRQEKIKELLNGFLPPILVLGSTFVLIISQPDLGTAVLISIVILAMLFVAGVRIMHALPLVLAFVPILLHLIFVSPYRLKRVLVFLDPWRDPEAGYQLIQSLVALGSGGPFGVGLGGGLQKLNYLPAIHSDFLFSLLGNETGFVGTATTVLCFMVLSWVGLRVALGAPDMIGSLIAFGVTCVIAFQAIVNIFVVTAMLPTKGIALPFMSAGGSALLFMMIGVGILLNVASHCRVERKVSWIGAKPATVASA